MEISNLLKFLICKNFQIPVLEHKNSSESIEPKCYLLEFTGSEVELILFLWVDNIANKRLETKSDIMRSIWTRFKASDIIIPFPQYDVHVKK